MTATEESTNIPKHLAELDKDEQGHHSVTSIRDLTIEEVEEIEDADDLVIKAGNAAAWQRAHHLFKVTMDAIANLQEADPPGPGEIERVRAAAGSLVKALAALAKELEANVQAYGASEVQGDFSEHAEGVRNSDTWRLVSEIADKDAGSFKAAPTDTVWQRASNGAVLNVPDIAFEAIRAGQDLLAHHYRAIEPSVTEAAKLLLGVKAEAPGGIPAIVEFTIEGETPTNFKPRQLALDRIEPAMRAVRMSSRLAEQEGVIEHGGEETEAEPEVEVTAKPAAAGEEADFGGDAAGDVGAEENASEEGDENGQEPVELSALFALARTLDSDLEKAWSAALDKALAAPAIESQLAAVYSLVSALQRNLARQAQEMASAGVDSRMEEWPLSEGRLAALNPAPNTEERSKQSGLAQLNAFVDVIETFEDLQKPANITVSFNQEGESVERFWSAGAFALLKDRLWLLERLTREQDRDVAAAIVPQETESSGEAPADTGGAFERLRLGTRALTHGDPEAAIFHGLLAIAGALGVPSEEITGKLVEDPGEGENPLSEQESQILTMAIGVIARSQSGAPDLPLATLLAKATLRAAHKLTLGPVGEPDLSASEVAELIESRQPLRSLEPEEGDGGGA